MLRERIGRHQLAAFVLVAFGWSWTLDGLYYLLGLWETLPTTFPRQWGVPLGGLVVVWASDVPVRNWLGRILDPRLHPGLYLLAVLVPLGITNVQQVLRAVGGGSLSVSLPGPLPLIVLFVVVNAVVLGGIEELGWRGVLQPLLQDRTSVLVAGIAVGILWWAWHLPLFLGHENFVLEPLPFLTYTVFVVGASVVFGAFVNVTAGSVIPLMVMHATTNLAPLLEGSDGALDDVEVLSLVVGSGSWWLLALALVVVFGLSMTPTPGDWSP